FVGLLLSHLLLMLYFLMKREVVFLKRVFHALLLMIPAFVFCFVLLSLLLKGTISYDLGLFTPVPGVFGKPTATISEILSMVFAHYSTFL
ncbi:MAG: hypothetical protein AAB276_01440, partial [Pseudomonadota bacterium]